MLPLHYGYKIWRKAEESNSIPLSENLVFKASRGTIPTALPSVNTLSAAFQPMPAQCVY